jgi:malate dehydrogenase
MELSNATIGDRAVPEVIDDLRRLQGEFISTVQERGAAIIEARGLSPAPGDCVSVAVVSSGEYEIPPGLQFGFPVVADGDGSWSVREGLEHDAFARDRIETTKAELESERAEVEALGLLG